PDLSRSATPGGPSASTAAPSLAPPPRRTDAPSDDGRSGGASAAGLPLLLVPAGDCLTRREPDSREPANVGDQLLEQHDPRGAPDYEGVARQHEAAVLPVDPRELPAPEVEHASRI